MIADNIKQWFTVNACVSYATLISVNPAALLYHVHARKIYIYTNLFQALKANSWEKKIYKK